jgi:thiol-disulfide isomerase/thioredoxin
LNTLSEARNQHLKSCFLNFSDEFYSIFKKAGQNPMVKEFRKSNGTIDTLAQLSDYRARFWDDVPFEDERLLYTPVIGNKLKRYINELTPQNPDSIIKYADIVIKMSMVNDEMFQFVSNWIALQYQPTKTTIMDGEAVYVYIIDKYFNEKTSHWFREGEMEQLKKKANEMKSSLLNRKGPDVAAKDPKGIIRSIYEKKAPYIIVYMYNPNCEHCQKETPKLNKFYAEWKNKGVDIFAIVLDTNDEEWKNYIRKSGIEHWTHVFDPTNRAIYGKYYVDITPEMYVLNPERIIIGKNLKTEQLAIVIERDMKKRDKK